MSRVKRLALLAIALALLITTVPVGITPATSATAAVPVDAKIEIVWPHDAQGREVPVDQASFVNVEVYLFERDSLNSVPCTYANNVILRWSTNSVFKIFGSLIPAHDLPDFPASAVGQRIVRDLDGKSFPVWVFNDVPILPRHSSVDRASSKTYFFAEVEGADARTNVWAHAADSRTLSQFQHAVDQTGGTNPAAIDAYFQTVWPHDPQGNLRSVAEASLVNVAVNLVEHSANASPNVSVGFDFERPVWLLRAQNNGFLERVKLADQVVTASRDSVSWPHWLFNDVDVAAARDPQNRYYFAVQVEGVPTHTTIWSHSADARTYFPRRDVPTRGGAECS